jgi:putative oxidoreductase
MQLFDEKRKGARMNAQHADPRSHPAVDPHLAPYGVTALRVALGGVMLAHGLAKLLVFTLPGAAAFFAAHGFPGWTAYPVTLLEIVGGALLVVGVYARLIAAALIPVMLGALLVHLPNGWMFSAPGGGWEYVAFLVVALTAQALLGDGAFALRRTRLPPLRRVRDAESALPVSAPAR